MKPLNPNKRFLKEILLKLAATIPIAISLGYGVLWAIESNWGPLSTSGVMVTVVIVTWIVDEIVAWAMGLRKE